MISKLEKRFTVVAILVISSVLLVLLLGVNVYSITGNIKRADSTINSLIEFSNVNNGHIDKFDRNDKDVYNKNKYRYFDLILDENGLVIDIYGQYNKGENYDILAADIMSKVNDRGFLDDYRYLRISQVDGTRLILLDYSFERRTEITFMTGSVILFFLAVSFVAVLVRVFLKPVMKPIKEADKKQKQFITDASHELRTPITIISTNIQLLEMEYGKTEWSKSILNQTKRLENLTDGLVTLSRLDEHDNKLVLSEVNLSNLVNDVVMGFEPAIYADKKTLIGDLEENIKILGHYDHLEKVVSTLMHNALKYSLEEGEIEVNLKVENKNVLLVVRNSCLIEKGSHPEFFERFYRAETSRNSSSGGFGIGLALAKSVIDDHQGSIEAFSEDEKTLVIKVKLKVIT